MRTGKSGVARMTMLAVALALLIAACGGTEASTDDIDPTVDGEEVAGEVVDAPAGQPGEPASAPTSEPAEEPTSGPAEPAPAEPAPAAPAEAAEPDGSWVGLITAAQSSAVTVDKVEMLSGEEARTAMISDGKMQDGESEGVDLVYLRNRNTKLRTLPVAADVTVQVYDCSGACTLVPWSYADLVAGRALPYGSSQSPFTITISDGVVTSITEVYLA